MSLADVWGALDDKNNDDALASVSGLRGRTRHAQLRSLVRAVLAEREAFDLMDEGDQLSLVDAAVLEVSKQLGRKQGRVSTTMSWRSWACPSPMCGAYWRTRTTTTRWPR